MNPIIKALLKFYTTKNIFKESCTLHQKLTLNHAPHTTTVQHLIKAEKGCK